MQPAEARRRLPPKCRIPAHGVWHDRPPALVAASPQHSGLGIRHYARVTEHTTEAWVGEPGDGLLVRPQDRERDGSVVTVEAILQTDGLTAQQVVVHHYATGFGDLLEFFDRLAEDWRGWAGERTFTSLEGDLALTATHDGHVQLRVTLRQSAIPGGWTAEAHVRLDPGEQLSRVVADLHQVLDHRA
jgi:hypothetical protein